MRILVVSNLYPPASVGGYELACAEGVERLRTRGHLVEVITARDIDGQSGQREEGVHRVLRGPDSWLAGYRHARQYRGTTNSLVKEAANQWAFRRITRRFVPDVLFVWSPRYTSFSLVTVARRCFGLPVCFYIFDEWWSSKGLDVDPWCANWRLRLGPHASRTRRGICRVFQRYGYIPDDECINGASFIFGSDYLLGKAGDNNRRPELACVIKWGVDLARFKFVEHDPAIRRLLYVGQILPHKGVHTAIEATQALRHNFGHTDMTLTIAGTGSDSVYQDKLSLLVRSSGLDGAVTFIGNIHRSVLPQVYATHDALLFPSVWEEPFGLVQIEAMACGTIVVSTATGGAAEIARHGRNALTFRRNDSQACALQIRALASNPSLMRQLRTGALETVRRDFDIARTIDKIEQHLHGLVRTKTH